MPVLDLEMWVQKEDGTPKVTHNFYKKKVASKFTILKRSAIATGTKKATLFQEGIRRLSHMSPNLPWSDTVAVMNQWSLCMRDSGYSEKERYDAIRGACMRHEEMLRKVREGDITSINRKRKEILQTKQDKGGLCAATWYLKGQTSNTVKCQATPQGFLAKELTKVLNKDRGPSDERIKVVEEGGSPAIAAIRKADPFRSENCRFRDPACIVEKSRDCALQGCVYEITCDSCTLPIDDSLQTKETRDPGGQARPNYVGMTMSSVHARMKDHLRDQRSRMKKSPMHRHDLEAHQGVPQSYTTRILTRERTCFPLSITEGLYIEAQAKGSSINERNEQGRGALVRIRAHRVS